MTKSGKKTVSKVSLKNFYEQVPGKVPAEECLPSKPVRRDSGFNVGGEIIAPSNHAAPPPVQRNVFNGPNAVFDPAGALDDFQNLALRPQHTFAPPSLANNAHSQKHFTQSVASPPKPSFTHPSAGFAPGAVGYGTSFPDSGVTRGGAGIPYPNIGHYPRGQSHVSTGHPPPAQSWAPHLQQQQQQQHNHSNSAGQPGRRDMLQLHGPVRAQSMPGLPVSAQPPPPPPKQHSMSQTNLSQAQEPLEGPTGTQWAEQQAAQASKEHLAMSKSCLVEPKSDMKVTPALVKPADPGQRPVLKIQPRSKPLEEVDTPADKPDPVPPKQAIVVSPKPPAGLSLRPKLNLKPRSKPTGCAEPALAPQEERKSSVFGSALPREVVLNNRGESLPQEPSPPKAVSGDNTWHTVHKKKGHHGPSKPHGHSGRGPVRRVSSSPEDDPFFCDYSPSNHSLSAIITSFESKGTGGGFSAGPCSLQVDDELPFMKRSLPTRTDEFF